MRLTDRDQLLFRLLSMFGSLTTSQIALLLGMHLKVLQRLLRRLCEGSYIQHTQLPSFGLGRNQYLWYLSPVGAGFMGAKHSKPRLTLKQTHMMDNNNILIEILKDFEVDEITCKLLPEHLMRQAQLNIIPDGSFLLAKKDTSALFFIENDSSGSEVIVSPSSHDDIELKAISYSQMFQENQVNFWEQYFGRKINRFRLLLITSDKARLATLAELVAEHDESGFIWITSKRLFDQKGIKATIWQVPATSKRNCSILRTN